MNRWLGLLGLIASGLAGCQVNRSPSDPFMRTTVPPPATGQAVPPPADAYYTPAPAAGGVTVTPGAPSAPPTFVAPPPSAAPLSPSAPPATPAGPPAYYNAPPATAPPPAAMPPAGAPPAGTPPANRYQPPGGFSVPLGSSSPQSGSQDVQLASANMPTTAAENAAASSSTFGAPVSARFVTPADGASDAPAQTASTANGVNGTFTTAQDQGAVAQVSYNEPVAGDAAAAEPGAAQTASTAPEVIDPAVVGTPIAVPATAAAATLRIVGSATEGVASGDIPSSPQAAPAEPATTNDGQPVRLAVNQPVPEITDLPQSNASAPPKSYGPPRSRLVFNSPGTAASPAASLPPSAPAAGAGEAVAHSVQRPAAASQSYGIAGDYETLHGRLEYSQSSRQWKLRYIPIDGQTDQYGGSVVLSDSPALASLHAGDFVIASGRVASQSAPRSGYSPQYELDQIIPQ